MKHFEEIKNVTGYFIFVVVLKMSKFPRQCGWFLKNKQIQRKVSLNPNDHNTHWYFFEKVWNHSLRWLISLLLLSSSPTPSHGWAPWVQLSNRVPLNMKFWNNNRPFKIVIWNTRLKIYALACVDERLGKLCIKNATTTRPFFNFLVEG